MVKSTNLERMPTESSKSAGKRSVVNMQQPQHWFDDPWHAASQHFRQLAEQANVQVDRWPIDGTDPQGQELFVSVGWFGPSNPRKLILQLSGLHGAEGFTGSAIQRHLLADPTWRSTIDNETAVGFVHVVNPFGMSWHRRNNVNNVDLNRNWFHADAQLPTPVYYQRLKHLLVPDRKLNQKRLLIRLLPWTVSPGLKNLFQEIAGGQAEFPTGIFYTGASRQAELRSLEDWLKPKLERVETLAVIDIHTGLGKFGRDMLMFDHEMPDGHFARCQGAFGPSAIRFERSQSKYTAFGNLVSAIKHLKPTARTYAFCHEFGTFPGPWMLKTLNDENRIHHFGERDMNHPAKRWMKQMFNPINPRWRERVLNLGTKRFEQAISLINQTKSG